MEQLIMRWKNDGKDAKIPEIPEDVLLEIFPNIKNAEFEWCEIVKHMEQDKPLEINDEKEFFNRMMKPYPYFEENKCFFLLVNETPAATVTVICNREKKEGYIHMVSCKPQFRGRGLGTLLNDIALFTLKNEGMKTAYLTTDDWRVPAIKSYLRAGFSPDLETHVDFKMRWDDICKIING